MSVYTAFIILLSVISALYLSVRMFMKRSILMLFFLCLDIIGIVILAGSFINSVKPDLPVEAFSVAFGFLFPFAFFIKDLVKMLNDINMNGYSKGLIEKYQSRKKPDEKINHGIVDSWKPIEFCNDFPYNEIAVDWEPDIQDIQKNIRKQVQQAGINASKKNYERSSSCYESICQMVKTNPGLYYNMANSFFHAGRYEEAIRAYNTSIELAGEAHNENHNNLHYSHMYLNLGIACLKTGKYELSAEAFRKASAYDLTNYAIKESEALSLIYSGKYAEALEIMETLDLNLIKDTLPRKANEVNIKIASILLRKGHLYNLLNNHDKALEIFEECLEKDSVNIKALEETARLLQKKERFKEAEERARLLSRLDNGNPIANNVLGMCLLKTGYPINAAEYIHKAIERDNENITYRYNHGIALEESGQQNRAMEEYRSIIDINPEFIEAYNNLGILLSSNARYREALEVFKKGILYNPDKASLYYNMAVTLNETGKNQEAKAAYTKALELSPGDTDIYLHLGNLLSEMKEYNEAISLYKKAIRNIADDNGLYYNLAVMYAYSGRTNEAFETLEKAIRLDPEKRTTAQGDVAFSELRLTAAFRELLKTT